MTFALNVDTDSRPPEFSDIVSISWLAARSRRSHKVPKNAFLDGRNERSDRPTNDTPSCWRCGDIKNRSMKPSFGQWTDRKTDGTTDQMTHQLNILTVNGQVSLQTAGEDYGDCAVVCKSRCHYPPS